MTAPEPGTHVDPLDLLDERYRPETTRLAYRRAAERITTDADRAKHREALNEALKPRVTPRTDR